MNKTWDNCGLMTWTKYKSPRRVSVNRPKSGWDQYPQTIAREKSASPSEVTYGRKQQSGIIDKNYYGSPHCKREISPTAKYDNPGATGEDDTKLLVLNVHFKVTDSDFLELFGEFESLKFSRVNFDSSGRPLGTGVLVFGKRADAMRAIELYNGAKLDGRVLTIQVATPEILATSQFKNAVKFVPNSAKLKKFNKKMKPQDESAAKSYIQGRNNSRTTVEELDAQLDQIVRERRCAIKEIDLQS